MYPPQNSSEYIEVNSRSPQYNNVQKKHPFILLNFQLWLAVGGDKIASTYIINILHPKSYALDSSLCILQLLAVQSKLTETLYSLCYKTDDVPLPKMNLSVKL